jgi:glycosyltransferase involved in cell wall biosynthesis
MEIIHVILGKANPNRMNGVNKVVYQLASKQAENNIDVSVWGITKDLTNNYDDRNFKTVLFKKMVNPFAASSDLLKAILSKKNKAVFHIHGGWIPVFSTLASFFHKHQIKYVYTPHGAYNTIAMNRSYVMKIVYYQLFEKSIIKNAAKIHCIGESEVLGLKSIYDTNSTFLLPYGFQLENYSIEIKNRKDNMIFGFVGRLDIYTKGLDLLINAFHEFHKINSNSKLWIIGDGPEKSKLKNVIVNIGLSDHIILHGSKFGDEKDMLIKQMDIFCHPSRNEGLPSSVLEASNFGIPCIVSKATNVSSFITKYSSGFVIENESEVDLRRSMIKAYDLWRSSSLGDMNYNAQKMVKESFNWDLLIPQFNILYSS